MAAASEVAQAASVASGREDRRTQVDHEQLVAEIAERGRAEDAYYEAQVELARVTRMGALAASVSHEIPVRGGHQRGRLHHVALQDPPNLEEAHLAVDCIAQRGTRASEVVQHSRYVHQGHAREKQIADQRTHSGG